MKKFSLNKLLVIAAISVISLFSLTSCATTVHASVTRPAKLDMHGATTVAVLPFREDRMPVDSYYGVIDVFDLLIYGFDFPNPESRRIAEYLTSQTEKKLLTSDYLSLISADSVASALRSGTTSPADAYITGTISNFRDDIKTNSKTKENDDGSTYTVYTYYREVNYNINYQIVSTKDNQVIAVESKNVYRTSTEYEDRHSVPGAFQLTSSQIDSLVNSLMKDVQPYKETVYVSLLDDKTKSDDMKVAKEFAKNNMIQEAYDKYFEIYQSTGMFEAGYNAALLLQMLGYYQKAYSLMSEVNEAHPDKRAIKAMKEINYELSQQQKLLDQLDAAQYNY